MINGNAQAIGFEGNLKKGWSVPGVPHAPHRLLWRPLQRDDRWARWTCGAAGMPGAMGGMPMGGGMGGMGMGGPMGGMGGGMGGMGF